MIPHELMKLSYWTWAACCWPGRLLLILVSFPFAQKRQNSQSPEDYMSIKFPPPWQGKDVKCQGMPGEILKLRFHLPPATTRELQYKAFEKSRGALESKQKHDGLVDLTKHWGWTVTTSKTCAETGSKKKTSGKWRKRESIIIFEERRPRTETKTGLKGYGWQDVV